jgi:phage/conjugal plasmid C-4 type zinc finger TraR family protein
MAQIHSIHLSENALARVRARMPQGPSRADCADCGEAIPLLRQQAVQGCMRCIVCQGLFERQ